MKMTANAEHGRAQLRVKEDGAVIVLPRCPFCGKIAPKCVCGKPHPIYD